MQPRETIEAFDRFLASRSLRLDAVVIGGTALVLLGIIERQTRDTDVLAPELSAEIVEAARAFAEEMRSRDVELADDWLNNGPSSLIDVLPEGWRDRTRVAFDGDAVCLRALGRCDLLKTKLFALCDRATDLLDCIAMKPNEAELDEAEPWVALQDANTMWPAHVHDTLADLKKRLRDGV